MAISVDAYRARLEAMNADSGEEWYRHFAGLKPTLELAAVDEEFEELFTLEACRELAAAEAPAELRRAAVEGHLTAATRPITDRIATREATLEVTVERRTIPYREVAPVLVNEPDAPRRRALHDARSAVVEDAINPMLDEALAVERERVADLGSPTLRALYEGFGWDLGGLLAMTEDVIAQTERLHERELDRALRSRVGMPLDAAGPQDVARLWRAPEFDTAFAADRGAARAAGDAGGDGHPSRPAGQHRARHREPAGQDAPRILRADPRARPRDAGDPAAGRPRRLAGAVPRGRPRAALRAHVARCSRPRIASAGDNGVTEGWAFLFDHLVTIAGLARLARWTAPPQDYARFNALHDLHMLRRYCGKLAYELELHGGASPDVLGERYVHHLGRATLVPPPAANRLVDVDPLALLHLLPAGVGVRGAGLPGT